LKAILSILPLDSYDDTPARTMQVVDDQEAIPDTRVEFQRIIDTEADHPAKIQAVERFEFYEQAKRAYCIVQTTERRLYGNIILKKGVVAPS
jgi:L-fucose mutarotase